MKSEQINELAMALAKAQSQMSPARKDATNPHLNSKYATLDSIIDSARIPLAENGLSFTQIMEQGADGLMLQTCLMHSSGQWMQGDVLVVASAGNRGVNEVQALGSALTYYKRYALAAMLGISVAEEDDDGHNATKTQQNKPDKVTEPMFATMDNLLFKVNQDFGLKESEAKEVLKNFGYKGFKPSASEEMYTAIKLHIDEQKAKEPEETPTDEDVPF